MHASQLWATNQISYAASLANEVASCFSSLSPAAALASCRQEPLPVLLTNLPKKRAPLELGQDGFHDWTTEQLFFCQDMRKDFAHRLQTMTLHHTWMYLYRYCTSHFLHHITGKPVFI